MKKTAFLIFVLVFIACEKDSFKIPSLDLTRHQVDILFVSETEGVQHIYTVQDTALNKVWAISMPYYFKTIGYLDPSWSNDPRKFAFSNIEKVFYPYYPLLSNIYIMNMSPDSVLPAIIPITRDTLRYDTVGIVYETHNFRPDWSPNKKSLIYISNRTGRYGIYQVYLDDTLQAISPHRLLTDSTDKINVYCYPSFSPDGRKILYTSFATGKEEIWVMDTNGTNKQPLTHTQATKTRRPRFSPDMQSVSFYSNLWVNGTDSLQVYILRLNGMTLDTLTRSGNCYDPAWHPSGQQIIYANNTRPGRCYIYLINRDGTDNRRLIPENKSYYPIWRPGR